MSDVLAQPVIECLGLAKTFREGADAVEVLGGVSLAVKRGERVAVVGSSGSGKSTLLHLLGGLDVPTAGEVRLLGKDFSAISDAERGRLRNGALGFVYQFHHLLAEFTALENVAMPLFVRRMKKEEALARAAETLKAVGLGHRLDHAPGELSGGERQRLSLAPLLTQAAPLYLLDEPIAHLDLNHQIAVLDLFAGAAHDCGAGVIMVLHEPGLADRYCDRALLLYGDGRHEIGPCRDMLNADRLATLYGHPLKEVESDGHRWFIPA